VEFKDVFLFTQINPRRKLFMPNTFSASCAGALVCNCGISADILDIENPYRAQLFQFFSILALNRAKLGVFLESDVWE
jgi:hypothetical protein